MNPRRGVRRPGVHAQRGAIGVLGALTLMLVVLFAVVVIDGGRLWYAKRHLQQVADVTAMSAANAASLDCGEATGSEILNRAQATAAANGYAGNLATLPNAVILGEVRTDTVSKMRRFAAPHASGTRAIRVVVTEDIPTSLIAPLLFAGDTRLVAEATAVANLPTAAFTAASTVANLDDGVLNNLFRALLGAPVNLSLAGFQGLANASLSVLDLVRAGLTVGTVDQVLDTTVDVANLLSLVANAINANGTANAQAVLAGQTLASVAVPGVGIRLGDIIKLDTATNQAGLDAKINALDLVTASLMLANKNNAVALNAGVLGINVSLTVIEPPQLAVGFAGKRSNGTYCTEAKTAQVKLNIVADKGILPALLDLGLELQVGKAQGGLEAIRVSDSDAEVDIATSSGIASLKLTGKDGTGKAAVNLLGLLPIISLSANVDLSTPQADLCQLVVNRPVTPASFPEACPTTTTPLGGAIVSALSTPGVVDIDLLGLIPLGGLLQGLLDVLLPVLQPVLTGLIDPLLAALGLQLGLGEVTLQGLEAGGGGLLVI